MAMTLSGDSGIVQPTSAAPIFSAWKSGATQDVGANTWTKVTFETEEFDTNSNFASSRFTPTVAGYYQVNASLVFDNNGQSWCSIFKNGAVAKVGVREINAFSSVVSCLIYLNGTTDYIECYGREANGYNVVGGVQDYTYFQAAFVRSA